ncbi:hypothetical protein G6M26_27290 [Agrobacterium tumefaciens]|nr:hypothetical protein [Agrobacterium tumefaciens]NTE22260.1 hypothetical protein [Agrobacterium tumefaciens]
MIALLSFFTMACFVIGRHRYNKKSYKGFKIGAFEKSLAVRFIDETALNLETKYFREVVGEFVVSLSINTFVNKAAIKNTFPSAYLTLNMPNLNALLRRIRQEHFFRKDWDEFIYILWLKYHKIPLFEPGKAFELRKSKLSVYKQINAKVFVGN